MLWPWKGVLAGLLGRIFSFCSFPLSLSPTGKGGPVLESSFSWSAGFVHNRPTPAQQGGFRASLVLVSYRPLKTAHRATQGRVCLFVQKRGYPSPKWGGAGGFVIPACTGFSDSPKAAPHGSNGVGLRACRCRFSTFPSKPHTGPHGAEFGSHRFFFVRLCSDWATKSRSSLQFTASWIGRIV